MKVENQEDIRRFQKTASIPSDDKLCSLVKKITEKLHEEPKSDEKEELALFWANYLELMDFFEAIEQNNKEK